MGNSFQDQFLKLGLVDKKKVQETKAKKHKARKQAKSAEQPLSAQQENVRLAKEAEAKKKERVRKLNLEREEKLKKRAEVAQLKQIIEQNLLGKDEGGQPYRFNVDGKIHRIHVSSDIADRLSKGQLGIVQMIGTKEQFEIVPKEILEKLTKIESSIFTHLVKSNSESDENDPYAEFQIPDDLMW